MRRLIGLIAVVVAGLGGTAAYAMSAHHHARPHSGPAKAVPHTRAVAPACPTASSEPSPVTVGQDGQSGQDEQGDTQNDQSGQDEQGDGANEIQDGRSGDGSNGGSGNG